MPPKRSKSQTGSAGGPPKWETGILTTPFVDVSRNVLVRTYGRQCGTFSMCMSLIFSREKLVERQTKMIV